MSLRLRRGPRVTTPTLSDGEIAFAKDTREILVGTEGESVAFRKRTVRGKRGGVLGVDLFDVNNYGIAGRRPTPILWKMHLPSMEFEELTRFDSSLTDVRIKTARLIPRHNRDYDTIIAYDNIGKRVLRFPTTAPVVTQEHVLDGHQHRWLANQGMDYDDQSGVIIYAEYAGPSDSDYPITDTFKVWRSADWGETWTEVFRKNKRNHPTNPQISHFHVVRKDPFNEGHWYLSSGDATGECFLWRSVDDGLTWTDVSDVTFGAGYTIHRFTNIYFTEDYMYWGLDNNSGIYGCAWCRVDRNLDGDHVLISPLTDLKRLVRHTVKTPYGILLLTQSSPTASDEYGPNVALGWLAPYDDLDNPRLIGTYPGYYFSGQIMDYSLGGDYYFPYAGGVKPYTLNIKHPESTVDFGYARAHKMIIGEIINPDGSKSYSTSIAPILLDNRIDV